MIWRGVEHVGGGEELAEEVALGEWVACEDREIVLAPMRTTRVTDSKMTTANFWLECDMSKGSST